MYRLPLVTILIPVYNGANYIKDAIESALAQTYNNIEILVVNDGSNDNGETEQIVKRYVALHPKVRYYVKENGGVASALNYGINVMEGEYFTWLSHDDYIPPDKILSQVSYMLFHPDADAIYGNYGLVDKDKNLFFTVSPNLRYPSIYPLFHLFRRQTNICTFMIKTSVVKEIGGFDERLLTTQDYDFLFKLIKRYKVICVDKLYLYTRIHEKQGSQTISTHISSAESMWVNFFDELSQSEFLQLANSPRTSIQKSSEYFAQTPYKNVPKCLSAKFLKQAESTQYTPSITRVIFITSENIDKWRHFCFESKLTKQVIFLTEENIQTCRLPESVNILFVKTYRCLTKKDLREIAKIATGDFIFFDTGVFCLDKKVLEECYRIILDSDSFAFLLSEDGENFDQQKIFNTIATFGYGVMLIRRDVLVSLLYEDIEEIPPELLFLLVQKKTTWSLVKLKLKLKRVDLYTNLINALDLLKFCISDPILQHRSDLVFNLISASYFSIKKRNRHFFLSRGFEFLKKNGYRATIVKVLNKITRRWL